MSYYFREFLNSRFSLEFDMIKECPGVFGIPDYIISESVNNKERDFYIVAIELKISNWNKALTQAFRYKNFADRSFVVLDRKYIHRPLRKFELFKKYKVGLASFDINEGFQMLYTPEMAKPYCQTTMRKVENLIQEMERPKPLFADNRQSLSLIF